MVADCTPNSADTKVARSGHSTSPYLGSEGRRASRRLDGASPEAIDPSGVGRADRLTIAASEADEPIPVPQLGRVEDQEDDLVRPIGEAGLRGIERGEQLIRLRLADSV